MELVQYIRLFRKWLWLFVLAAFLAGGISFVLQSRRQDVFRAETTLAIGSFIQSPDPSSDTVRTGFLLSDTYAQLTTTFDVLQGTVDTLDLTFDADLLRDMISTRIVPNTSLLVVSVTFFDPILAADIANEVANQLIINSPSNLTQQQESQLDLANEQITSLSTDLADLRTELVLIDNQLATSTDATQTADLIERRNTLVSQINQASSTIAQFSSTIANLQQRSNSLDIVEQARVPTSPTGTSIISTTILGVLVGASLAGGIVLLIEYLDDTIRTSEDAASALALPILGVIARFGKKNDDYSKKLYTNFPSNTTVSEGYRNLRTNLLFGTGERDNNVYVVTSPGPTEGKSVTSANLAASIAMAGLKVLLIDADLRRPTIHQIFGLPNEIGLTTLLSTYPNIEAEEATKNETNKGTQTNVFSRCLQQTQVSGLTVITSGFIPQNPAESLGSTVMHRWIKAFRFYDVVIFDTPPILAAADSAVLASNAKADVIIVLEAGRTRRVAAHRVKEQFAQLGCDIKGVVINNANLRDEEYYGYGYYYSYYSQPESNNGQGKNITRNPLKRSPSDEDS